MNPSTENMTRPANKEVKLLIQENIIESLKVKNTECKSECNARFWFRNRKYSTFLFMLNNIIGLPEVLIASENVVNNTYERKPKFRVF